MIQGSTTECLKHYLSQLPWETKGCSRARQSMVDFLGVTPETIRRWRIDENKPVGLVLVKLRYFLEHRGYQPLELKVLEPVVYSLGKLIAYGVVNYEQISRAMGYVDHSELLQVLHGSHRLSSKRMDLARQICAKYQEQLKKIPSSPTGVATTPTMQQVAVVAPAPKKAERFSCFLSEEEESLCLLRSINEQATMLLPRLESLLSDEVPPERRRQFRERTGKSLPFELSNRLHRVLNALCSEKAREIQNQKNQKKR